MLEARAEGWLVPLVYPCCTPGCAQEQWQPTLPSSWAPHHDSHARQDEVGPESDAAPFSRGSPPCMCPSVIWPLTITATRDRMRSGLLHSKRLARSQRVRSSCHLELAYPPAPSPPPPPPLPFPLLLQTESAPLVGAQSRRCSGAGEAGSTDRFWQGRRLWVLPPPCAAPPASLPNSSSKDKGVVMSTVSCCTVLFCTTLYCPALSCTVLYCPALYCAVLHCNVLGCTALYCTALHCSVLYYLHCYRSDPSTEMRLTWAMSILAKILGSCAAAPTVSKAYSSRFTWGRQHAYIGYNDILSAWPMDPSICIAWQDGILHSACKVASGRHSRF